MAVEESDATFTTALDKLHSLYSSLWDINKQLEEHEELNADPGHDYTNLMLDIKNLRDSCVDLASYAIFLNQFVKVIDSWISHDDVKAKIAEITGNVQSNYMRHEKSEQLESEVFQFLTEAWEQLNETSSIEEAKQVVEAKIAKCKMLTERLNDVQLVFGKRIMNEQEVDGCIKDQKSLIEKLKLDLNLLVNLSHLSINSTCSKELEKLHRLHMNTKNRLLNMELDEEVTLQKYQDYSGFKIIADTAEYQMVQLSYTNKSGATEYCDVKLLYNVKRQPKKLVDVNIVDCPVDVSDLILDAIALNDFFDVIPELLERLYSM